MTDFHGFKGRAKRIDDVDLPRLGHEIGVGEDELHAFMEAETRGSGFDSEGRPRILFERHKFHKYVPAAKRSGAIEAGLASVTPGGYGKESEQYGKLARAMAIDEHSALLSCSWGLAQVMGFNHALAGYPSCEAMVLAFMDDEENHLKAAVAFIKATKLDDELRRHNWAGFAYGYNGENYRINKYDEKLATAFAKWRKIKDTPWTPGQPDDPGPETPTQPVPPFPAPPDQPPPETPPAKPVQPAQVGIGAAILLLLAGLATQFQTIGAWLWPWGLIALAILAAAGIAWWRRAHPSKGS